jgi:hypothetical protein
VLSACVSQHYKQPISAYGILAPGRVLPALRQGGDFDLFPQEYDLLVHLNWTEAECIQKGKFTSPSATIFRSFIHGMHGTDDDAPVDSKQETKITAHKMDIMNSS